MNDEFLYQIRPPLRKEFVDTLRRQLTQRFPQTNPHKSAPARLGSFKLLKVWKFALLITLVFAAALMTFSEQVRASTLAWIKSIAGFNVEERSESPLSSLEKESEGETGLASATIVPSPVVQLSLKEVVANPPFDFGLPTWTPAGYTLGEPAVSITGNWVMLSWTDEANREITLLVERSYGGYNLPVGEDSSQEITIQGKSALLVRGNWDSQHQWNPKLGIAIYWLRDGHDYRLIYSERETQHNELTVIQADERTITDVLVHMAESIP